MSVVWLVVWAMLYFYPVALGRCSLGAMVAMGGWGSMIYMIGLRRVALVVSYFDNWCRTVLSEF